jgi:uncharacterized phage protein (TIGR02218 family)
VIDLSAAATQHLQGSSTTLTRCWLIVKRNGEIVRGTALGRDLTITIGPYAGTYVASAAFRASDARLTSGGSVQNLEVEGSWYDVAVVLSAEELEAGLYDQATAVLFLVNWQAPDQFQRVQVAGTLGEFTRDSNGAFRSEVRGVGQALAQQILRSYSERCDVKEFADDRCKLDVEALQRTCTVTSVTDRKHFIANLTGGPDELSPTFYNGGRLRFTSGANDTFVREVHTAAVAAGAVTITLWEESPHDVANGDTFVLPPGCDRLFATCQLFDNVVNFRGHGLWASGKDRLLKGVK